MSWGPKAHVVEERLSHEGVLVPGCVFVWHPGGGIDPTADVVQMMLLFQISIASHYDYHDDQLMISDNLILNIRKLVFFKLNIISTLA